MLWIYSCNPASCAALHVRYIYVVLALVWGRANSSAKLSSSSSGHVQGTHSSSTLGSCSLTSYLSPLSQFLSPPGKAIFLSSSLFPTNMQAKTIPATCTPLELTDSSPGTGADFVIRLWECFAVYSSGMAEEKAFECHLKLGLSMSRLTGSGTASLAYNS